MRTKHFKRVDKRIAQIFEGGWAGPSFKGAANDERKIFAKVPLGDDFSVFY